MKHFIYLTRFYMKHRHDMGRDSSLSRVRGWLKFMWVCRDEWFWGLY